MEQNKFDAILPIIISHLTERLAIEMNISDEIAIEELYASKLYSFLEIEATKVWQYSTEKLFELYLIEKTAGKLELPEY